MRYALLALGAVIGTVAVILWRSKGQQMSDQWMDERNGQGLHTALAWRDKILNYEL